jgi:hypothetical protein
MSAAATLRRATRPRFLSGQGTLRYFTVPVVPGDDRPDAPTITLRRAGPLTWSGCIRIDGETERVECVCETLAEAISHVRAAIAYAAAGDVP